MLSRPSSDPYRYFKSQHRSMSQSSLSFIVLPSIVYPFFEHDVEQNEIRKALLIKQETE